MSLEELKAMITNAGKTWKPEWDQEEDLVIVEAYVNKELETEIATPEPIVIKITGVQGEFQIEDDQIPVNYILTSASLSKERDGDTEKMKAHRAHMQELLGFSTPVREIIDVASLNFDELMQRDLDDYRISQEIITYLVGQPPSGVQRSEIPGDRVGSPRFFPPIIGVIVPYDEEEKKVEDYYPLMEERNLEDVKLRVTKFGECFSITDNLTAPTSQISLNKSKSRLVIVDGQHRAMAVLAAYRTAHEKWAE